MTKDTISVLEKALELPPIERAELVEQLLTSFEFPGRKAVDELWAKEVENRINAYNKGEIKAISLEEVLKKYK